MTQPAPALYPHAQRNVLAEFFRLPEGSLPSLPVAAHRPHQGFFRFGKATCYGTVNVPAVPDPGSRLPDTLHLDGSGFTLPFDPAEVIGNLHGERYQKAGESILARSLIRDLYYGVRSYLPDSFRHMLQRTYLRSWKSIPFPAWPVDSSVEDLRRELLRVSMQRQGVQRVPFIWFWPDGATSAALVTHDVETQVGLDYIPRLLEINRRFGIQSSYQLIPAGRYTVTPAILARIRESGGEVNIHDLTHGGNLFEDRERFREQAREINRHAQAYEARGFRAACMYRNQEWFGDLQVEYDMSVPTVAHLEPQRGGCCTVFPYLVGDILEIPLTMTQDFSLFRMLKTYSMDLWEQQIAAITAQNGLMSFIIHPDYVIEEEPLAAYRRLLQRLADLRDHHRVWLPLPGELASWWRQRSAMELVESGGRYTIEGEGHQRARIGFAVLDGDTVRYEVSR